MFISEEIFNPGLSTIKVSVKGVALAPLKDDIKLSIHKFTKGDIRISNNFVVKTNYFSIKTDAHNIKLVVTKPVLLPTGYILAPSVRSLTTLLKDKATLDKGGTYQFPAKTLFSIGNTSRYRGIYSFDAKNPNKEVATVNVKSDYPFAIFKENIAKYIDGKETLKLLSNYWFSKFNKYLDKPVKGPTKEHKSFSGVFRHRKANLGVIRLPLYIAKEDACDLDADEKRNLVRRINSKLSEEIKSRMGQGGALVNRTGAFADSAYVTNMTKIAECKYNINYSYANRPYAVFDPKVSHYHNLSNPNRDPNKIIGESIREIAHRIMGEKFKVSTGGR